MLDVNMKMDMNLDNKAYTFQKTLVMTVLPRALDKAAVVIKAAMLPELPDGIESGTRALQSEKSRTRFPGRMKDQVRRKLISDNTGVLKIVGVGSKAKHVNFDHGDKAKSIGRVHILWGKKAAEPPLRRQLDDIPKIVESKVEAQVRTIVAATIRTAIANGELK